MSVDVRPMAEDDRFAAFNIARQAFGQPPVSEEQAAGLPTADRLVATHRGRIVGMLRLLPWRQFFGGLPVPAAGIAAVAVAQDARGRGVGGALLRETLGELDRRGVAIAALNFSGMGPYRKVGFALAGSRVTRSVAVRDLPSAAVSAEAIAPDDPAIRECYSAFTATSNGLVDRPDWLWDMVLGSADQLHAFGVRSGAALRGYLLYAREPDGNAHLPFEYAPGDGEVAHKLVARDFIWLDGDAAERLLSCIAADRAFATDFLWPSGPDDPLASLFGDLAPRVVQNTLWMARLIDVPTAFASRGYPRSVEAEVTLTVDEPNNERSAANYVLRFSGGRCAVDRADRAGARIELGALSALFTGWLLARDAARLGSLRGATEADVGALELALAGPRPWMADHF